MATILAHIVLKEGQEAAFEKTARSLVEDTMKLEPNCVRYEYWRGAEPRHYYTLLAFADYAGFMEHQSSDHHEGAVAALGEAIESIRLEWLDPVQGASPMRPSNPQDIPTDASEVVKRYAAMFPVDLQDWWLPLRNA